MFLLATLRMALGSLGANRLRSTLTVLGIVIGVSAVIALVGIGAGAERAVTAQFEALGSNVLTVSGGSSFAGQGGSRSLASADVAALDVLASSAAAIAPEYRTQAPVLFGRESAEATILGVTPQYASVRNLKVARGRFITPDAVERRPRVVVLGSALADDLFGGSLLDPLGQSVRIRREAYTVVGILASQGAAGFLNLDEQAYVPLTTAQLRFGGAGPREVHSISLTVGPGESTDFAQAQVRSILRARHRLGPEEEDDFNILNQAALLESVQQTTQIFTLLLGSIAAISLLVGGIGIMNVMLVSVTERTREIGIRKAVGAKRGDILLQFVLEAILLSLSGGTLGLLAGWGGSRALSPLLQGLEPRVTSEAVLLALGVSVAIGLFFGIYPAGRAAALNPIEALRYE